MNQPSWLKRLFERLNLRGSVPKPSPSTAVLKEAQAATEQEQPVPQAQMTQLEQDKALHKSLDAMGDVQSNPIRLRLNKQYAADALAFLIEELKKEPGADSKDAALKNLEGACKEVNKIYPVLWQVGSSKAEEFDCTTCYYLLKHIVLLNPNGAYCIVEWAPGYKPIFCKPGANNSAFVMPPSFGGNSR